MWFYLSTFVVYAGFYLVIVFLTLGIACALFYLAELIEEFTTTTKRLLTYLIRAELVLHAALIIDRQPLLCLATGAAAQVAYHALLKRFPYNTLSQGASLVAAGLFLAATGLWIRHFWVKQHSIEYMVGFCLVTTWLTPFFILLGVSGDQSSLPGAGGFPYASPAAPSAGISPGKKQRRGLALRMFDVLRRKRDDVIPDIMSSLPGLSKEKM